MRYAGTDFLDKHCDLKIFEYDDVYVCTTFKIGTRVFSSTSINESAYDLISDDTNLLFDKLNKNKKVYIVIKNPANRFLSGATQLTFEGATHYTAAYSLARWGSESYFFTNIWPKFIKDGISNPIQLYNNDFNTCEFIDFDNNLDTWKIWLDIIHFNITVGDTHLSEYHKYCYNNCYKLIHHTHDVEIIEDTKFKNFETFKNITNTDLPTRTHENSRWTEYLKEHFLMDIDITSPRVSLNPKLISEKVVMVEDYITEEFRYYNKLKALI